MGVACSHNESPPPVVPSSVTIEVPPPPPPAVIPPVAIGLNVSAEVQRQCKLRKLESMTEAPKFSFDSSLILADEMATLQQVATCVTSGPLKGKGVTLVGRADPRGPNKYNMALGERRATAVQDVLVKFGVASNNVTTSSRGKKDATGTDDEGWQIDRRVDIGVTM
jgi:peptidoglycan-associated lipoprotein